MNMKEFFKTNIPLNRKERFYTGTVFPMIVAKDNFKHLPILFSLIDKVLQPKVLTSDFQTNIQFFTEYSLVESINQKSNAEFVDLPTTKDTPDVLILIEDSKKILIAIEAKMYDVPSAKSLNSQMKAQSLILESIRKTLEIDFIYHFALLPDELAIKLRGELTYQIVTWEEILINYKTICKGDYFYQVLNLAIEEYQNLKSHEMSYGKNNEETLTGQTIYNKFKRGSFDKICMGRSGGLNGPKLSGDIASGQWKYQKYETTSSPTILNRNWFYIKDFVEIIDNKI